MLSSLLRAIKGEKQLSFNHWRYRLLHWVFCVNPTSPADSTLPKALYTHYCPLFHLTNLLAVFLWAIILCRFLVFIGKKLGYACSVGMYVVGSLFDKFVYLKLFPSELLRRNMTDEEIEAEKVEREKRAEISCVQTFYNRFSSLDSFEVEKSFEAFWSNKCWKFEHLSRSEVQEAWNKFHHLAQQRIKDLADQKKNAYDQMIFLVNLSRVFLRGSMWLIYGILGLLAAYILAAWVIPGLIWLVIALFSVNWLWLGGFLFKITATAAIAIGLVLLFVKFVRNESAMKYVAPPFVLTGDILKAGWKSADNSFENFKSFLSIFYEENCPPIKIVETSTEVTPE